MDDKDMEAFIRARKQQVLSDLMATAALLPLALLMFVEATGIGSDFRIALIMLAVCMLLWSQGPSKWVSVPRRELVNIIERQINRDPVALQLLAEKTSAGKKSRKHLA